jgi:hypothetical protein
MLLVAETTDTPVWWLFGATAALALVTAALVVAAWKALGALQAAVDDRHADVFSELGRRWTGAEMTEALIREMDFTREELAALFTEESIEKSDDPELEQMRLIQARDLVILLRIPDYFEDAVITAEAGCLSRERLKDHIGGIASEKWDKWSLAVAKLQEADDLAFVKFEALAKEVKADDEARRKGAS